MSEPQQSTPKNHPFATGQQAESPIALDEVHKQQLKALKKMCKHDLIMALQAKNLDATGTKQILYARMRTAYLEEALAAAEPPAEEHKVEPQAEETLPPIGEDDADEESDDDSAPNQKDDSRASSDSSDDGFVDNWKDVKQPQTQESEQAATDKTEGDVQVATDDGGIDAQSSDNGTHTKPPLLVLIEKTGDTPAADSKSGTTTTSM